MKFYATGEQSQASQIAGSQYVSADTVQLMLIPGSYFTPEERCSFPDQIIMAAVSAER